LHKVLRFATIFGLLLASGLFAGACTGDDSKDALTLEEFFQQVQEADDAEAARSDAIDQELEAATADAEEAEAVDATKERFPDYIDSLDQFISDLEGLEPPEEAQDLHEEAVNAGQDAIAAFRAFSDDNLDDVATFAELGEIFNDPELMAAFERFDQACLDAEALATENDITIDLNCEE